MKPSRFLLLPLLFFATGSFAQSPPPSGFNFQAIVRDGASLFAGKANIEATISLRRNAAAGANVFWQEVHTDVATNAYGQLNLIVGELPNGAGSTNNVLYPASSPFQKFEEIAFKDGYWVEVKLKHPELNNNNPVVVSDVRLQAMPYSRWAANGVPPGTIMAFAGDESKIPKGWRLCNGDALSPTGKDPVSGIPYADLFAAIQFGWGKSGNNFNLPDLQGQFLRGVSKNSGADPDVAQRTRKPGGNDGNNVGSYQLDAFQGHRHEFIWGQGGNSGPYAGNSYQVLNIPSYTSNVGKPISDGINGLPNIATETRPKNANVHYIIKL